MVRTSEPLFRPQSIKRENVHGINTVTTTRRIRVAIIEDDERVRTALVFQLSSAGFEVVAYSSAEELLESTNARDFDCVVADIYLPRMNGLQLQEELNRTVPYASIVFITGHAAPSVAIHPMPKATVAFF